MNYLVIDLEMCRVPKHYRSKTYKYAHEIIQVGAVLLDEAYEVIGRINQYVHPEHGVIDHFISNLTGIQKNQVKNAPCLKEVLVHMVDWLGNREYKVYAWSNTDHSQLQQEIILAMGRTPGVHAVVAVVHEIEVRFRHADDVHIPV